MILFLAGPTGAILYHLCHVFIAWSRSGFRRSLDDVGQGLKVISFRPFRPRRQTVVRATFADVLENALDVGVAVVKFRE